MAVLSDANRKKVYQALHRAYCDEHIPITWMRAEIDAALASEDSYLDVTGESALNLAFPLSFRQQSTVADRALLVIGLIIARRLVQSPAQLSILRTMLNNIGS